jgi:hypothetical protein
MKKLLALILAAVSIFMLASCAGNNTTSTAETTIPVTDAPDSPSDSTKTNAFTLVNSALDGFFGSDSLNAVISANIKMSSAGVSIESTAEKELFASSLLTSPVFRMNSSITEGGVTETSETYFKDGAYYVTKNGFNGKIAKSEEADEDHGWKKTFEVFMAKLSSGECVTYFKINEDGTREIKAESVGSALFSEYVDSIKESFGENFGEEEGVTVQYGEVRENIAAIVDKNGALKEYSATIALDITLSDGAQTQTFSVETKAKTDVKSASGSVTVEPPSVPLNSFTETTTKDFGYTFASSAYYDFAKKPDVEASMKSYIAVQIGAVQMEIQMSGTMQANNLYSSTPLIRERAVVIIGDSRTKTDLFCRDGYYYVRTYGDRSDVKEKLSVAEYDERYGKDSRELFPFFMNDDFTSSNVTVTATGERAIYFSFESEKFKASFAEHIDSAVTLLVGENDISGLRVQDAEVMMTIDANGALKAFEVSYTLEFRYFQGGAEIPVSAYIYDETKINATENVSVEPMTDLESFEQSKPNV